MVAMATTHSNSPFSSQPVRQCGTVSVCWVKPYGSSWGQAVTKSSNTHQSATLLSDVPFYTPCKPSLEPPAPCCISQTNVGRGTFNWFQKTRPAHTWKQCWLKTLSFSQSHQPCRLSKESSIIMKTGSSVIHQARDHTQHTGWLLLLLECNAYNYLCWNLFRCQFCQFFTALDVH